MKKIFTLLTISLLTTFSIVTKAQLVASVSTPPTVIGDTSTILASTVNIHNTSASTVIVKVQITSDTLGAGLDTYFCWGTTCYPPGIVISQAFILGPDSIGQLICDVDPNGTFGADQVTINVYDTAHAATNKVTIHFTFDFTPTGMATLNLPPLNFLNCSQSSMGDFTNISYSISNFRNGKLVMCNLLGSVVKEIILPDKKGTLSVSTSDLPAGIYMYFLYNNDEPLATKKTIISHR